MKTIKTTMLATVDDLAHDAIADLNAVADALKMARDGVDKEIGALMGKSIDEIKSVQGKIRLINDYHGNRTVAGTQLAVFNKPYKYKWEGKKRLRKLFRDGIYPGLAGSAYGDFTTDDGRAGNVEFFYFDKGDGLDVDINFAINDRIGVTGEGDAFRIFATVMAMIKEFISWDVDELIGEVMFSAEKTESPSRSSLYKRMVRKYAKDIGFKAHVSDDKKHTVDFTLRRM